MKRLFVALDMPDAARHWLIQHQPEAEEGLRLVREDQLHLTLAFIGEAELESVKEALAPIRFEPLHLRLSGLGYFQGRQGASVFWAGFEPSPSLQDLHRRIGEALKPLGVKKDRRPYRPHITLARSKTSPSARLKRWLQNGRSIVGPSFEVNRWTLYSSILQPSGPIYTREALGMGYCDGN